MSTISGRTDPVVCRISVADVVAAMITSVRAVATSPVPMIGWAAVIAVLLVISALPLFLGLLVTLPVLGHATWHLYRRVVEPAGPASDQRPGLDHGRQPEPWWRRL